MTLARVAGWCFIMDTCVIVTARHQAKQGERIVSQAIGDGEHLAVMRFNIADIANLSHGLCGDY